MRKVSPAKLLKSNPFVLAPMDDVTDIAFRKVCEDNGASYSISELTSVDALVRDKVTLARYQRGNLKTSGVQLFGKNPETFCEAADFVGDNADFIDVNFGCPSATVTGNDSGSMLLKDPKNVGDIVSKLVKHLDKPVTAKIRLGYSKMTYLDVACEVEDAGAEVLAVHGRTAKQKYTGVANWDAIAEIYNGIDIPLIGNGDIRTEEDIDKYLGSHADALMIGRAAIGNPLIFEQFKHYNKTGEKIKYEDLKARRKELFMEYLEELDKFDPYNPGLKIKRQSMWFFKGVEGVKNIRREINEGKKTIPEVLDIVRRF
jgi:nifR3 family TIM-barrel protein